MRATAERLHEALANLALVIDGAACVSRTVDVPSYGGGRPSSVATLVGAGREGRGEHVGWTDDAHGAFRTSVARVRRGTWRLGEWAAWLRETLDPAYDRAALEAAAIDLALRQHATTLGALAGVIPRPPRYVVSFARTADPLAEAARHPGAGLKVDVDPTWPESTWQALGALGRVVVLDWKGAGDAPTYGWASRWLPAAVHEDPAPPFPDEIRGRLSLDAPITTAATLDGVAPVACNLKPARMGGVLEALDAASRCAARGIGLYVGGMFEVDIGRQQLRDLAAVLCPDAPNDLAPIPLADRAREP